MKNKLAKILMETFHATYIRVEDDSHKHKGHFSGAKDSHFSVCVVSDQFEGVSKVQRHKLVYSVLDLKNEGIHALKIEAIAGTEYGK